MSILHHIAELIGTEHAIKLGQALGGVKIYCPITPSPEHALSLILGHQHAQLLCDYYGGDEIYLPKKTDFNRIRNALIRREYQQLAGAKKLSRADFLARKYGLSRRGILYIVQPERWHSGKFVKCS